jgi:copper chaperone CopZ
VGHVTEALLSVFGVKDARVDLKGKSAEVDHDDMVTLDALIAAIGDEGYEASIGG